MSPPYEKMIATEKREAKQSDALIKEYRSKELYWRKRSATAKTQMDKRKFRQLAGFSTQQKRHFVDLAKIHRKEIRYLEELKKK